MSDGGDNAAPTVAEQEQQQQEEEEGGRLGGCPEYSRMVGGTEYSWCKAVSGGTGITVLALLFDHQRLSSSLSANCHKQQQQQQQQQWQQHGPSSASAAECCGGGVGSAVQGVVDELQWRHPRLRSRLAWIQGRPGLSVSEKPLVRVHCDHDEMERGDGVAEKEEEWVTRVVEAELLRNREWEWPNGRASREPEAPMMAVRLLWRTAARGRRCLLLLRLHTAICDRASAATILTELLQGLSRRAQAPPSPDSRSVADSDAVQIHHRLVAIEDGIPPGQARKPFWAHGIDLLGYSLGSRRHALLPFQHTSPPLDVMGLGEDHHPAAVDTPATTCRPRSEIVRHTLSVEHTRNLLQACSAEGTSRLGALSAAGLKATAMLKQLGERSEQYAVVTLLDCRSLLEPVLPESTIGFYHSAILNTHGVNEGVGFWELARRCSDAVAQAVRQRKHFTDMGDVNLLMGRAMQFPQLTPDCSLRTSHLVLFHDALHVHFDPATAAALGLLDSVGCSSVHGVGPTLAVFDSIQQGALHTTCVYPAPLHSRAQISHLLHLITTLLVTASASASASAA